MKLLLRLIVVTGYLALALPSTAEPSVLLQTFNNPNPASSYSAPDLFGVGMAFMGNDRVIIGAFKEDSFAPDGGVVYLFRTNGTLLTTITNPSPAYFGFGIPDDFGAAVAAVGNYILVGSAYDGSWLEGKRICSPPTAHW
jgi:hypothetical protein